MQTAKLHFKIKKALYWNIELRSEIGKVKQNKNIWKNCSERGDAGFLKDQMHQEIKQFG